MSEKEEPKSLIKQFVDTNKALDKECEKPEYNQKPAGLVLEDQLITSIKIQKEYEKWRKKNEKSD